MSRADCIQKILYSRFNVLFMQRLKILQISTWAGELALALCSTLRKTKELLRAQMWSRRDKFVTVTGLVWCWWFWVSLVMFDLACKVRLNLLSLGDPVTSCPMIGLLFLLHVLLMSAAQIELPTWIACYLLLLLICLFLNAEPTRNFTNNDGRMREWDERQRGDPLTFGMLVWQQLAACGCRGLNALSASSFLYLDQTLSWEKVLRIGRSLMYFLVFVCLDVALVPIAVAITALDSPMWQCILLCAPARCSWWEIGLGMLACTVLNVSWMCQHPPIPKNPWSIAMVTALSGAWVGPVVCALLKNIRAGEFDSAAMLRRLLPPQPWLISPLHLSFCQSSVKRCFRDGRDITTKLHSYNVIVCYHDGILFTLNNRTLYSALYNEIEEIAVLIVKKPLDWDRRPNRRFTAKPPYTFVHVRTEHDEMLYKIQKMIEDEDPGPYFSQPRLSGGLGVVIPALAFPGAEPSGPTGSGLVVLEVDNLINSKNRDNQESSLTNLLKKYCPQLHLEEVDGERSYARVRIRMEDEALIREVLKAIGRERGKRGMSIRVVPGSQIFESPRF